MTIRLTPAEFACLGLSLAGFNEYRQKSSNTATNLERFRGSYGASPETCAAVFEDLQTTNIADAHMTKPNPRDFLMTFNWMKTYKTENQLAGHFGCVEKTARKWIWEYTGRIRALKEQKVSLQMMTEIAATLSN
jgi:hypothetical protein